MPNKLSRKILTELEKWTGRREILAIKGPRQAGKTTVMEILMEELLEKGVKKENLVFVTFEDMENLEAFIKDSKAFVNSYIKTAETHYFFFDEYQYVPEGGKRLKLLYDLFPNAKFIISGSSSLELTDKLAKFLVGRMFSFNLYPFSFGEFLDAKDSRLSSMWKEKNKMVSGFVLEGKDFATHEDIFVKDILKLFGEYAVFGGYPEVIKAEDIETKRIVLKNIYETYLTKDIIELLKIGDVMKFRNIVVALSSQHSGLLSFDSLASDCKSYYKEVRQFISILEETYVVRLLSPFHRNVGTELKKNPKSYFLDSGLRNYVIKNFNDLELREDKGGIAEGLAFSALADLVGDKGEIKYWRTLSKAEVDFVIKIGDEIIPIEAKYQNLTKPEISRSFRSFLSAYNPKRAIVLTKDFWDETEIGGAKIKFIPLCYL